MKEVVAKLTSPEAYKLVGQVEQPFKSVPHLPASWTEFLAKIIPYLVGLSGVLSVIGGLSTLSYAIGFNSTLMWVGSYLSLSPIYLFGSALMQLLSGALSLLAFNYLKSRAMTGWMLLFWNMVLGILNSVLTIVFGPAMGSSLLGAIIGTAIGLYLLFEIKRQYK